MDQHTENAYLSYQHMVSQTNESMAALSGVCESLGLEQYAASLDETRERMKKKLFSVGIMGEFNRGKSTVINALLGKEIVPADIVATSATLNYIRWDATPRVTVHFKDGGEQQVGIDELSTFVTKLTPEARETAATVEDAVVYYPCKFCQNGVQIVDTPGLNEDERMTEISEKVIPTLDAIIMVVTPDSPFGMSEAEFVRNKVMTSDLGRIIFVINKFDNIRRQADRERLLNDVKHRVRDSVLEKMAALYGEGSEEYAEAESKLGGVRVYGISALDALTGRLEGDEELVQKSGFLEFEEALSRLLTEERGMLELIAPVNTVLSVAKEARKSIAARRSALEQDSEHIRQVAAEGKARVEEERKVKKAAVEETKNKAATLYADLLPELDAAYDQVEVEMLDYVAQLPIDPASVANDKAMEQMSTELEKALNNTMIQKLSGSTERLLSKIESQVSKEMSDLHKISEDIYANITEVQRKLTPKNDDAMFDWGVVAFDALTNGFGLYGIGGIITGWKENGALGALVGGGAGFLAGYGAMYALSAAAVAVGVGGMVVALPILVIGGAAAAFGGKAAVKAVFYNKIGERNAEKLRGSLNQAVKAGMQEVRQQRVLETWLKTTTSKVYNTVADTLDREIETTLTAFEANLSNILLDQQKKEGDLDKLRSDLNRYDRKLDAIAQTIAPVKAKLAAALNGTAGTTPA